LGMFVANPHGGQHTQLPTHWVPQHLPHQPLQHRTTRTPNGREVGEPHHNYFDI
jgi:hypothetical protein